ncbi:hypothetical protein F2Q69_00023163 [Brassica cretica]|uniref:Uncharacterized protein n=1 Tax=Brassica cretica TaxID=69181 RepID=A0A8S9Q0A4_BRACR|nr:hypothetical protein F2Q69_00023163 [Brassica cretica]
MVKRLDAKRLDTTQIFTKRLDATQSMVKRLLGVSPPIRNNNPDSYADTPFTDEITLIKMPRKFSFPSIKAYDGTSNPDDHDLCAYYGKMDKASICIDLQGVGSVYIVFLRRALVGWSRLNSSIFGNMEGSPYRKFSISRRKGAILGPGPENSIAGKRGSFQRGSRGRCPACLPESTGVAHSQQASLRQDIAPDLCAYYGKMDKASICIDLQGVGSVYIVFLRRALVGWSRLNSSIFGNMEGSPYRKFSISRRKGAILGPGPENSIAGKRGSFQRGSRGRCPACLPESTGVAHSQQASLRQDIAPVIL